MSPQQDQSSLIRVLVLDPDPEACAKTVSVLAQFKSIAVAAAFSEAPIALNYLRLNTCDIFLLDVEAFDTFSLNLIQTVKELQPGIEILLQSSSHNEAWVMQALLKGANGYVSKLEPAMLEAHIQSIFRGGAVVSSTLARQLVSNFGKATAAKPPVNIGLLTERERDVLNLISKGLQSSEIARTLGISSNTVTTYSKSLYRKLKAKNRSQAVAYAVSGGHIKQIGDLQTKNPEPTGPGSEEGTAG